MQHTIEAVLQLATASQLSALDLSTGQEGVQSQTEQVVAERSKDGISVEQTLDASPSDFLLQLLPVEVRGRE